MTEAVLTVWEPGHVGVRLSPVNPFNDITDSAPQATFEAVTAQLNAYGLAYLHVVENRNSNYDFQRLRQIFNGAYIANGGYARDSAMAAIAQEQADFIAFGALFIANPDLPERLRLNAGFNAPRVESFYAGGPEGYDDYPALGRTAAERLMSLLTHWHHTQSVDDLQAAQQLYQWWLGAALLARAQSGSTAVTSISILARSSSSAATCTQLMAGKLRPMTSR